MHYAAGGFDDEDWGEEEGEERDYDEVCFMASLPVVEESAADLWELEDSMMAAPDTASDPVETVNYTKEETAMFASGHKTPPDYGVTAKALGMQRLTCLKTCSLRSPIRHLVDLCGGGMLTGLASALAAGIPVLKYTYVDTSFTARRVSQHRIRDLLKTYPGLLKQEAVEGWLDLPQNVLDVSPELFRSMPRVDLIVATPPCMPFSFAGGGRG